ncbi:nuclease HARBI1-like 22 [Homarus americanus]|uniref:Putative nuclease HARBI1 n=2 Tax=Homarus americanus TaxID=6706 RepID=A0A8J5JFC0_HOMAM|nr:nuclease HARBI1-like 22 [Homarus americanus]
MHYPAMELVVAYLHDRALRRERRYRDPLDPINISDENLIRYYRFPRCEILRLCEELDPFLRRRTRRSHAVPIHTQVLVALRFYASGTFQHVLGDTVGLTQASVSRIIRDVTQILTERARFEIKMPTGDSGYPLEAFLMTPFRNPSTPGEVRYNNSHTKTRVVVVQTFGVLKSRFRCLHRSGGSLQYDPSKCAKIVNACFLLHNYCLMRRVPLPHDMVDDDGESDNPAVAGTGQAVRANVVQEVRGLLPLLIVLGIGDEPISSVESPVTVDLTAVAEGVLDLLRCSVVAAIG